MRILIANGRVIDPANDMDQLGNVCIENGKIIAVGHVPSDFKADKEINADGQVVCPGLVDMRARLREPGYTYKGNIKSETNAAVKGGITTLCCPPDTLPVIDTPAVVELIHRKAEQAGKAKVLTLGALTQGLKGHQIGEMDALLNAGCVGVSNALNAVNTTVMRHAMEYAASLGMTVYVHAEDESLSGQGCAHEGSVSVRLGLQGIPEAAETIAVAQLLQLIELTGVDMHFCQISTKAAAKMIARAQHDGLPITADVTAHQLFMTDMDIGYFDSRCHVRPPFRTQRDRDALREALHQGTFSAICSDHQPHDADAKLAPFPSTEPGISALETLLPLTLRLAEENVLPLMDALARVTFLPANILGVDAGTLDVGVDADICIFDPEKFWELNANSMVSFGHNTPFMGWELKGLVSYTLLNGDIVYQSVADESDLVEEPAEVEAEDDDYIEL